MDDELWAGNENITKYNTNNNRMLLLSYLVYLAFYPLTSPTE